MRLALFSNLDNHWSPWEWILRFISISGCQTSQLYVHACVLTHLSSVWLRDLWTVAHQVSLSVEFSKQEYWGGSPCPPLGNFPNPKISCGSCIADGFFTIEPLGKPYYSLETPNWTQYQNSSNMVPIWRCWDADINTHPTKLCIITKPMQNAEPVCQEH